jgi:phenylacetate-CoA ligase
MEKFIFFKYSSNIDKRLSDLKTRSAEYWLKEGRKQIDSLIKFVLKTTSAYRKFLKDNGIDYSKIKGFSDLQKLPIIDKNNYLRKYDYLELFPNKDVSSKVVSATSGSTGEPFYFPRGENLDEQYEYVTEIFLKNQWEIDKLNTLFIITFGLGIWIGGIYTYKVLEKLKNKGYKLSIVPLGTNKELFFKTILKLGSFYDQIIIGGYPPFVKDLVDEGSDYYKINWKKYKLRILNAAESFPESFREYIARQIGLKDMLNDNINIYGTVELGTMAHETCLSNLTRHLAVEKDKVWKAIFPEANRTPTLAQYHPYIVWFEEKDGSILASGYGDSIPLLRYSFPDRGGVIYFDEMVKRLKSVGIDIFKEAEKRKYHKKILKLPFVYVYERSDFAVSLVGINIFPEYIRQALLKSMLQKYLTGKFSMQVVYDKNYDQKLQVHVELKKNVKASTKLKELIIKEVLNSLKENSTEFNHLWSTGSEKYRKQLQPDIFLHLYEDPKYFRPGIKQKWIIK